jgi:hypothetical protein
MSGKDTAIKQNRPFGNLRAVFCANNSPYSISFHTGYLLYLKVKQMGKLLAKAQMGIQ